MVYEIIRNGLLQRALPFAAALQSLRRSQFTPSVDGLLRQQKVDGFLRVEAEQFGEGRGAVLKDCLRVSGVRRDRLLSKVVEFLIPSADLAGKRVDEIGLLAADWAY